MQRDYSWTEVCSGHNVPRETGVALWYQFIGGPVPMKAGENFPMVCLWGWWMSCCYFTVLLLLLNFYWVYPHDDIFITYEGWSISSFLFMIQRKIRILSKFCDVHIEIKYISSNWILFEKQLWRHSLWHVTSCDIPKGVIVVNRFSRVASAKFEIFVRSKKHSVPLRNAHLKLLATDPNTI